MLATLHEFLPAAPLGLQARIPFEQRLETAAGDRYYFCVLEARVESTPDSIDDVKALLEPRAKKLAGAIVGRALYDGRLDPAAALQLIRSAV